MKLVVLCLLAVSCWSWADASSSRKKLEEVMRELKLLNEVVVHSGSKLNAPQNVENCCGGSALRCFQANIMQLNVTKNVVKKRVSKSLCNPLTEQGLNFCDSENSTRKACQSCESYPEEDTQGYLKKLESLIQKALVRLMS